MAYLYMSLRIIIKNMAVQTSSACVLNPATYPQRKKDGYLNQAKSVKQCTIEVYCGITVASLFTNNNYNEITYVLLFTIFPQNICCGYQLEPLRRGDAIFIYTCTLNI